MTPASDPDLPSLEAYLLGLIPFDDAQRLQRRLVYDLGETSGAGAALILCEHPPTVSVGRSGSRAHILPDDDALRALGVRVQWVNRGGGCVLHIPGQLSAYVALSLPKLGLNLNQYIEGLNNAILHTLEEFEIKASIRPDLPGVFLGNARIASVGIAVNRWIAYHGFTLNVGPFLEPFEAILEEPGIGSSPLRQTSMESRRQRLTPMPKVRESLLRSIEDVFRLERHHVFTNHPLIRRKALDHAYVPSPG